MKPPITGRTKVAGVAGQPVAHSLSPLLHNAWLEAAGIDGVYVAFPLETGRFEGFITAMRGGAIRGLNVTIPFKEPALVLADRASARAQRAAAANVLTFEADGSITADNTDGLGLLGALRDQAPGFAAKAGPVVVLGAGGAARGAVAALLGNGAPEVRVVNRTLARAEQIAEAMGGAVMALPLEAMAGALDGATLIVNATSVGLEGGDLAVPLDRAPRTAVVMDMVYKPLETPFLAQARAAGLVTVDGLAMLIGQARPAFELFYGCAPPAGVDVRALALEALAR